MVWDIFVVTATNISNYCLTCTAEGLSFDKIRSGFQLTMKFQQVGGAQVPQIAVEIEGLRG